MRIPFDRNKSQIDGYVGPHHTAVAEWVEIEELQVTLSFIELVPTRSSVKARFRDTHGRMFLMFFSDFNRLMKTTGLPDGGKAVTGTFRFIERGGNIGIYLKN